MEPRPVAPLFGNWPYDPTTASLTLRSGHHPEASITSEVVKMWLKTAQQGGFARVRTNAVSPQLAGILANVGFSVKQELSLLTAPLQNLPPAAQNVHVQRVTATQAIRIDCAAFHGEWAIDSHALLAAKQATQFHRLRGLGPSRFRRNSGYCLSGFTPSSADAQYGYIQRLAVHALDLPLPVKALVLARAAGKSGHAGDGHRRSWKVNQANMFRTVRPTGKPFNARDEAGVSLPGGPRP
jgi:hypothetical protein